MEGQESLRPRRDDSIPPNLPADVHVSYNPDRTTPIDPGIDGASLNRGLSMWPVTMSHGPARDAGPPAESVAYIFKKLIGEGGFGEVWESVQTSLDRVVAVKRMRSDIVENIADSRDARAYGLLFRQEAVTAAMLEHPNIVPIHDLGIDENGLPLLAMKMVRGQPWIDLLRQERDKLSYADYLARHVAILLDVAQAVAFAHSRGIIHRDLKPAQVMVGEFGEVLLMDWGLAVVFDHEVLAHTRQSVSGFAAPTTAQATNPAGTLGYMAPEQTEETAASIGPWTDVYLLGGTLYYVLTGKVPHHGEDSQVVFLHARAGHVPPLEQAAPKAEIPAELAAIAMRALHPRREERHQGANEFREALQDYLSGASKRRQSVAKTIECRQLLGSGDSHYRTLGECLTTLGEAQVLWPENPDIVPLREQAVALYVDSALANGDLVLARVQAERLSDSERREEVDSRIQRAEEMARRQVRIRHAAVFSAFTLLFVVLVGGALFTREVMAERTRAQRARTDAEGLIAFMLEDLNLKLEPVGRTEVLADAGLKAISYFESLPPEERTGDAIGREIMARLQLGEVLQKKGDLPQALELFEESKSLTLRGLEKDPDNLGLLAAHSSACSSLAGYWGASGDQEKAIANAREADEAASKAARLAPARADVIRASSDTKHKLAGVLMQWGRGDEALEAMKSSRDVYANIPASLTMDTNLRALVGASSARVAQALINLARYPEAAAELDRSLAELESLAAEHPDDTVVKDFLADVLLERGRVAGNLTRHEEACQYLERSLEIREVLCNLDGGNLQWAESRTRLSNAYSDELRKVGKLEEALVLMQDALVLQESVVARKPKDLGSLHSLSQCHRSMAEIQEEKGNLPSALESARKYLAIQERIMELDPVGITWLLNVATARNTVGRLLEFQGKVAEAESEYRREVADAERLCAREPLNIQWKRELSAAHVALSRVLERLGDYEGALASITIQIDTLAVFLAADPANPGWFRELAVGLTYRGRVHQSMNNHALAEADFQEQGRVLESLLEKDPDNGDLRRMLAIGRTSLSRCLARQGKMARAREEGAASIGIMKPLVEPEGASVHWKRNYAVMLNDFSDLLAQMGCIEEALHWAGEACVVNQALVDRDHTSVDAQSSLAISHLKATRALLQMDRLDEAETLLDNAREFMEPLAVADPANSSLQRDFLQIERHRVILHSRRDRLAEALKLLDDSQWLARKELEKNPEGDWQISTWSNLLLVKADLVPEMAASLAAEVLSLESAKKENESDIESMMRRAKAHILAGQRDEAILLCSRISALQVRTGALRDMMAELGMEMPDEPASGGCDSRDVK